MNSAQFGPRVPLWKCHNVTADVSRLISVDFNGFVSLETGVLLAVRLGYKTNCKSDNDSTVSSN